MHDDKRSIAAILEDGLDMVLNLLAFMGAYVLTLIALANSETPVYLTEPKVQIMLFLSILWSSFVYQLFNVNKPVPYMRRSRNISSILLANAVCFTVLMLLAFLFLIDSERFVVIWLLITAALSTIILISKKRLITYIVRAWRKSNYRVKKIIIVGDNEETAREFVKQVTRDDSDGVMVVGGVGRKMGGDTGCEKLGDFEDLEDILKRYKPDYVVFAVDSYDKSKLIEMVNMCDDRCIKVYFLPVIYGFFKSPKQIEHAGSMPIINIHSTPLDSRANAFIKRAVDIIGSLALIIVTAPIMLVTAIGVKLSSPGPVLFKQPRVGKMGRRFTMYKFRSMRLNTESDTAWSTGTDPRKTKFGAFIRSTSIDELPQLFNVLLGSMSLVGPRPEIPHFVEHFKHVIPLYMVKHYVKPGMTGLAQIKGLRGDTSVEDRIHEDIAYIENWSFALDMYILLKTPFKAFNKSEKFVSDEGEKRNDTTVVPEVAELECLGENSETDVLCNEEKVEEKENLNSNMSDPCDKKQSGKKIIYAASVMGHINNFHLDYIRALRDAGHTVKVMAKGEGADFDIPFEKKLFSPRNTDCRKRIREIILSESPDVIILNTSLAAFHIRFACPRKNRPRIVNIVHGYLFSRHINPIKRNLLLFVEKLVRGKTDVIVTMNEEDYLVATKYSLAKEVYRSRGMGAVARPVKTQPETLRSEFLGENRFVMSFVGELSARKNQEFLIRAHKKLLPDIPEAMLWLIGEGGEGERLRALAEELGVSESVIFTGRRDDACDFIRASDLYVSASSIEGMPFNLIEALGCERCVLASNIKGHADLISDGESGFLYEFGDTDGYISRVIEIYKGEKAADKEKMKESYDRFSKESVFPETLCLIERAVSNG